MSILDKARGMFGINDEDYDEYEETGEIGVEEEEPVVEEKPTKVSFQTAKTTAPAQGERKVSLSSIPRLKVILVKPERYEEAIDIADSLGDKKTVVLNLEAAPKDVARRLVDFLSGVAYAHNGNVQKIANSTFLITPYNVDISGIGLMDDIDSSESLY